MIYPVLDVAGKRTPLGGVAGPGELPELLRHVAGFYDDNPDVCAELFSAPVPFSLPRLFHDPFAAGRP